MQTPGDVTADSAALSEERWRQDFPFRLCFVKMSDEL